MYKYKRGQWIVVALLYRACTLIGRFAQVRQSYFSSPSYDLPYFPPLSLPHLCAFSLLALLRHNGGFKNRIYCGATHIKG